MKTLCKIPAIALAAAVLMAGLCPASSVPTEWTVRIGPRSAAYQAERRHGDALALKASLVYNGQPLPYSGPARLYAQTNGMGSAWWDLAPCTVNSNILEATWLPSFDTGADVVDLFLGGPSNYQAAARIRFLPSPGTVPNALPLPVPVLDFATVIVTNAPFATFEDLATATNEVLQAALHAVPAQISDGTNTIDAAGKVYKHHEDWIYSIGSINYTASELDEHFGGDGGYLSWLDNTPWDSNGVEFVSTGWFVVNGSGTSPLYLWNGDSAATTNRNLTHTGYSFAREPIKATRGNVLVGRLALTNDLSQFLTSLALITNYTDTATNAAVQTAVAASSNYTDTVAAQFEDGTRIAESANTATFSLSAGRADALTSEDTGYTAGDLLGASTNAATWAANQVMFYTAGGTNTTSANVLTYQAASNSVGFVSLLAGTNTLHLAVPTPPITGRIRDFGLTVTTEDAATITLDPTVSWHFDAASTNLAAGSWSRIYCTESPANVFTLQLWTPDSSQEATP